MADTRTISVRVELETTAALSDKEAREVARRLAARAEGLLVTDPEVAKIWHAAGVVRKL